LGIAHDGDADRCLAVDHEGNVIDGDQIMAVLALAQKAAGELKDNVLVATVMSNLGLKIALRNAGITIRETGVGDRYVLEEMRRGDYTLGGEQSGHVIFSKYATTGDGLLTGLQLAAQVAMTGKSLKELASAMTKLPQIMINVKNVDKSRATSVPAINAAIARAEAELGDSGRVLLRPSGTEALVRVMVEAADIETAERICNNLVDVVRSELTLGSVEAPRS
jgi:phosphoglucosamine mutase